MWESTRYFLPRARPQTRAMKRQFSNRPVDVVHDTRISPGEEGGPKRFLFTLRTPKPQIANSQLRTWRVLGCRMTDRANGHSKETSPGISSGPRGSNGCPGGSRSGTRNWLARFGYSKLYPELPSRRPRVSSSTPAASNCRVCRRGGLALARGSTIAHLRSSRSRGELLLAISSSVGRLSNIA
jgi:hypothetical protein